MPAYSRVIKFRLGPKMQRPKTRLSGGSRLVRVNYCEQSLKTAFMVHPKETVANVRRYAGQRLMNVLQSKYGTSVSIDEKSSDIYPQPVSESQAWGELPENAAIFFDASKASKGKAILKEKIPSPSSIEDLSKLVHSLMASNDKLNEQLTRRTDELNQRLIDTTSTLNRRLIQTTDEFNQRLVKTTDEFNQRLVKTTDEFNQRLVKTTDEFNQRSMKTTEEMNRLRSMLNQLQLDRRWLLCRYVMDCLRDNVAKTLGEQSWHDINKRNRESRVTKVLGNLMKKTPMKFNLKAEKLALLLADDAFWLRQQGNIVAHSGDQKGVAEAIRTIHPRQARH